MYSNIWLYLLLSGFTGKDEVSFCQIIVSRILKPISLKYNACLKDVPVSEQSTTASLHIHTTQQPSLTTLYRLLATSLNFSKFHSSPTPWYDLKLSYGGLVITISTLMPFSCIRSITALQSSLKILILYTMF